MKLIGVCGASGSGKTTVCKMITDHLHDKQVNNVLVINLDNFYKSLTAHELETVASYNFDHPDAIDYTSLIAVLTSLKEGNNTNIPMYNFETHQTSSEFIHIDTKIDVVILEGILIFNDPILSLMFDVKIFVKVDMDVCLTRRIRRDCSERGRQYENVLSQWERFVKPCYVELILPQKRGCHIVIPNAKDIEHLETTVNLFANGIKVEL